MFFNRNACIILIAGIPQLLGSGLIQPLTPQQVERARNALVDFKANPKGPYFQIRWFCKDGTVQPPAGTPCKTRGGGVEYAELSPSAKQLANWNLDIGVVLASLDFLRFFDSQRNQWLPRELVLEKYLTQIDDGWVYRRAKSYRGAR